MLKDEQFLKDMGVYFRKLRKSAGLSQLEVSKRLGYGSAQFISNWERGLAAPPIEKLKTLIDMYHANPQEVFNFILNYQEKILRSALLGESEVDAPEVAAIPLYERN